MNATIILNDLSRDKLPPTAMNPRRLFGSLSIHKRPFPHSRLPNELLSYIFLTATHHFEDRYEAILTPITISHVCSRWREVAISAGGLWTNLILTFPTCRSQLSRTMTWLSRSEPYPIDILLDFRDPSWDWDENSHGFHWQDMEAIVRPFLTHVKRWCHVELLTDTWAPIFTFLWYTRRVESAPLLRSISLSRCNAYFASRGAIFHPVQLKEPIPLFGGLALEALRNVSLAGVHLDWARSSLRNLTSLEFKYHARGVMPSLDQFFGILAGCTNLHHLSIIGWGPQLDNAFSYGGNLTEPRNSMQLQHLTSFSFGFIDVNYAVKLLSLFSFPSIEKFMLEDVSFTLDPSENWQDATPILDLLTPRDESGDSSKSLSRSSVGLSLDGIVSLQLHSILSNESAFSHFYSALPNLRKLGLFGTDDALRALNPLSDTGFRSMCPVLQELECRDVDSATLVDVVRSRAETGSVLPLDSITFDSSDEPVRPTLADCLKLRELGIKILYRSR
ncbi:hypothetical protein L208DRAFT_1393456 [Tricholoma matsutake]|nr:hypothetical protein L208DRAFT_1393456 [Tricholoma matsutake 945]